MLHKILTVVQLLSGLAIIGLILIQHGKGADMGAAFGSGASGSLFGATGSSNFLSRSTAIGVTIFLATTLALSYVGNQRPSADRNVIEKLQAVPPGAVEKAEEAKKSTDATFVPGSAPVAPAPKGSK